MILLLQKGIGQLEFGMKQNHVEALLGRADKTFKDEEKNTICVYNDAKLRLTFYQDEDFKLGYLICANPAITIDNATIIGEDIELAKSRLPKIKAWETENFDFAENHFNEQNWLTLQEEFGKVAKIEMGAPISDKDELKFSFKG